MPFTIFVTNTTADADEVIDNFYHLGGDRMPYDGNSLAAIDNTYDLGSSTYRWADLYCNYFEAPDSITTTESWIYITDETLSVTTSSIEITGLDYDEIEITFYLLDNTATAVYMVFNGDSGTNYGYYNMSIIGTVGTSAVGVLPIHSRDTNQSSIILNDTSGRQTSTSIYSYSKSRIFAATGYPRIVKIRDIANNAELTAIAFTLEHMKFKTYSWNNKTNTITSIKIFGSESNSFDPNTKISVWGKKL